MGVNGQNMKIKEFAEITRRIIARDGFEEYLPTAYFPGRRHIVVIEGVPDKVNIEDVALKWASTKAEEGEEYFVAFKINSRQFKVVRRSNSEYQEALFDAGVA
jgi:hypothetical protein